MPVLLPDPRVFRKRRQELLNRLGPGLFLLPTAKPVLRNGDVLHDFRPGSDFFYLSGFDEPEAVLVAYRRSPRQHRAILFVRPRDRERELWDGPRRGPRGAVKHHGVDEAYPMAELYQRLEPLLKEQKKIFYRLGRDPVMDGALAILFERIAQSEPRGNPPAHPVVEDPIPAIASMRLVKDRFEIASLEAAGQAAAAGHCQAMRCARPGMMEYALQAELEACFRRSGSRRNGYPSIVASGPNACVLHYTENDREMRSGDLVLVDAGAELGMYTADITRTFPVSGRFTPAQAEVYDVVLRAQKAAIRAVRPGRRWNTPHLAARRVIADGLLALGVVRGKREKVIEKEAYRPWFMHGTSHWLGMDVHDVGGYQDDRGRPLRLAAGMVLTIEPGLYFSPRDRRVPKRLRGIGVRIEDDCLVTVDGCRVLTSRVPKDIAEVEALCTRGESPR